MKKNLIKDLCHFLLSYMIGVITVVVMMYVVMDTLVHCVLPGLVSGEPWLLTPS